jgi:hypothetical protein
VTVIRTTWAWKKKNVTDVALEKASEPNSFIFPIGESRLWLRCVSKANYEPKPSVFSLATPTA